VVATGIGGSPEQVSPEVTGFLVPPADAQALADRLETLISDRALRVRMGRAGRVKIATELSLDQTTAGIDKIYREALQKNP